MSTMAETAVTTQVYRVYIKASPEAIWDAITKPEWNEKYGYPGRGEYDLRPGGAYRATAGEEAQAMGMPELLVEGEVIEADPPRRLVQTWRAAWDPDLVAEGFTRVTWEIEKVSANFSRLTVVHELEGAPIMAQIIANKFSEMGGGGWAWILSDLKSLLETGSSM